LKWLKKRFKLFFSISISTASSGTIQYSFQPILGGRLMLYFTLYNGNDYNWHSRDALTIFNFVWITPFHKRIQIIWLAWNILELQINEFLIYVFLFQKLIFWSEWQIQFLCRWVYYYYLVLLQDIEQSELVLRLSVIFISFITMCLYFYVISLEAVKKNSSILFDTPL